MKQLISHMGDAGHVLHYVFASRSDALAELWGLGPVQWALSFGITRC